MIQPVVVEVVWMVAAYRRRLPSPSALLLRLPLFCLLGRRSYLCLAHRCSARCRSPSPTRRTARGRVSSTDGIAGPTGAGTDAGAPLPGRRGWPWGPAPPGRRGSRPTRTLGLSAWPLPVSVSALRHGPLLNLSGLGFLCPSPSSRLRGCEVLHPCTSSGSLNLGGMASIHVIRRGGAFSTAPVFWAAKVCPHFSLSAAIRRSFHPRTCLAAAFFFLCLILAVRALWWDSKQVSEAARA